MSRGAGEVLVDARGHKCPVPTLRLRRALASAGGREVRLLADDPMARIDVPHFLHECGGELLDLSEASGVLTFRVRQPNTG